MKNCINCNKEFKSKRRGKTGQNAKFCSISCITSFTWRGRRHTLETKKKISETRKKKKIMVGIKNPNWKGGITSQNKLDRVRFTHEMRDMIFERDNYTCQLCGIRGVDLQVDHIQSWAEYIELRFSMDNCRTLCAKCHYQITFGRSMPMEVKTWGKNLKTLEGGTHL